MHLLGDSWPSTDVDDGCTLEINELQLVDLVSPSNLTDKSFTISYLGHAFYSSGSTFVLRRS